MKFEDATQVLSTQKLYGDFRAPDQTGTTENITAQEQLPAGTPYPPFAKSGAVRPLASREGCRMSKRSMLGLFELNGRGRLNWAVALPGLVP
jgi:hypothetical protein